MSRNRQYDWERGTFALGEKVRPRSPLDALRQSVADHPILFAALAMTAGIALLKYVADDWLAQGFTRYIETHWEGR